MSRADIIEYASQALTLVLILSLPAIVVASAVGLLVSIAQALTQIQEQTLSFAIKLIAVIVTIFMTSRWVSGELYNYAVLVFNAIPQLPR